MLRNFVSLRDFLRRQRQGRVSGRAFVYRRQELRSGGGGGRYRRARPSPSKATAFCSIHPGKRQGQPVAGRDSLNLVAVVSAGGELRADARA